MKTTRSTHSYKTINQDYEQLVYKKEDKTYSRINKEVLMSFSSFTKYLTEINLSKIPETTLLNKKNFGKNVMSHLQTLFENKIEDINNYEFFSNAEELAVSTILQEVINQNAKIQFVEKMITNGRWYGYVDMIITHRMHCRQVGFKIVEIKTSSSDKLEFRHILQVAIYYGILGSNKIFTSKQSENFLVAEVWIYNTKTNTITKHKITKWQIREAIAFVDCTLSLFNLDRYKFNLWKGNKNDYERKFKIITPKQDRRI